MALSISFCRSKAAALFAVACTHLGYLARKQLDRMMFIKLKMFSMSMAYIMVLLYSSNVCVLLVGVHMSLL